MDDDLLLNLNNSRRSFFPTKENDTIKPVKKAVSSNDTMKLVSIL